MIFIKQISLAYGERVLFRGVSTAFSPGDRIGLVGSNGSGKTSLLRILASEEEADSGIIEKATHCQIGYLPQDGISSRGRTLIEECHLAFPQIMKIRGTLESLEAQVQKEDNPLELLEKISSLEEQLHLLDAETMDARIEKILSGLGFERHQLSHPTDTFSGGWQMRIALAKLLLASPDLLLLDEPTNHLDLEAQEWMVQFLKTYPGSFIIVSHDRGFLDSVTNRTLHLHHGQLDDYAMPYSRFEEEAANRREQRQQSMAKQQKEIARVEKFINRFRYKATKAKQVQSRIKALAKIDQIDIGEDEDTIDFTFPEPGRGPQKVADLIGINKSYGDLQVLKDLQFRLERGEKIAVVGRNGRGKSTFGRILAGVEEPDSGIVHHGEGVKVGWFAQHQTQNLDPNATVLESAELACGGEVHVRQIRSLLGAFLFRGDDVLKRVSVLSGGEKNRLALVRIMLSRANLLVLDEPTNHLDLASKTVLQGALMDYSGAVVIIAHDRDFLDPMIDRVFAFEPEGTLLFHGNVSQYLEDYHRRTDSESSGPSMMVSSPQKLTNQESPERRSKQRRKEAADQRAKLAPLKKELAQIEQQIQKLETENQQLESQLSDPEFYKSTESEQSVRRHREVLLELEQHYANWERISQQLETNTLS